MSVKAELAEAKQQAKAAEAAKAEVGSQLKTCASQQTQLQVRARPLNREILRRGKPSAVVAKRVTQRVRAASSRPFAWSGVVSSVAVEMAQKWQRRKSSNRSLRIGTMDESQTSAVCVYMLVRATITSREIGGRRETAA